ncbi:MAG: hypothetical protein JRH07_15600 [Deltaproteobacteria bacterium]|nr:hypothetical protein [Deltaproteobacteria bacterium]
MTDMVSQPTNRGLLISPRGNELVLRLYNAIRSLVRARHDVSALHETIGRLLEEEGQVSIEIRRDRFLLNDRKVEMRSGHAVNRILLAELRKRGIGRIEFSGLPDCPGLEDFLKSLMGMGGEEGLSGETAVEPTDEVKIGSVRVKGLEPDVKSREAGPSGGERACYAWVYFYATVTPGSISTPLIWSESCFSRPKGMSPWIWLLPGESHGRWFLGVEMHRQIGWALQPSRPTANSWRTIR